MAALTCLPLQAQVICVRDPNTGKWINPSPEVAKSCVIPSPPPRAATNSTAPSSEFIWVLESSGEVSYMPADGWLKENTEPHPPGPVPSALTAGSKVGPKSVVRTGATGRVKVSLAEDHTLEAAPDTDFMIDSFTESVIKKRADGNPTLIKLYKGLIRLKLLKFERGKTCVLSVCRYHVYTPNIAMTIRGTDVEIFAGRDMTGHVKLYSGSVSVTLHDSDKEFILEPGQMLIFLADGSVKGPFPIPNGP